MASAAKIGLNFVLGRCVPSVKQNAAKIRVSQLLLDERINMVRLRRRNNLMEFSIPMSLSMWLNENVNEFHLI